MNAAAIKARAASQNGTIHHVVFSHFGGVMVMSADQAHAFRNLVEIDATYYCGVLIGWSAA